MGCHGMWCDVRRGAVMWFDVMCCHVMWCGGLWCDVMSCHVIWCEVMWRDAMGHGIGCSEVVMLWVCVIWLVVRSCEFGDDALWARRAHVTEKSLRHAFRCAVQPWDANHNKTTESHCHSKTPETFIPVLFRTTKYCAALQSSTQHTTKYYSVLHSTAPYCTALQHTTKYCSVLQSTAPNRKHCSVLQSSAPHYKVLLRTTEYNSVLQSTTPYYSVLWTTSKYFPTAQRNLWALRCKTQWNYHEAAAMRQPFQWAEQRLRCTTLCWSSLTAAKPRKASLQLHQLQPLPRRPALQLHNWSIPWPN